MEPTATLTNVSNAKVDTINTSNQTFCKSMTALLYSLGLLGTTLSLDEQEVLDIQPFNLASIQGLTLKQQGTLLKFIGVALAAIGEKVGERTVEAELLDGGGYASIDAAIADVPLRFAGEEAIRIARNLEMVKGTVQMLDAMVTPSLVLDMLNQLLIVRNNVVYAASQVKRG